MAEKKIGSRVYSVGHVKATDAIKLKVRVLKIIGAGVDRLPEIIAGMKNDDAEKAAKSNAALIAALSDIFTRANPDEVADLMSDIISIAQFKKPSGNVENADIDGDFYDEFRKDIYPVVAFVLKEVLSDFFGGLDIGRLSSLGKT